MKQNKFNYLKVIQQLFGQTWEDVSEYETDSTGRVKEGSGKFKELKNGRKREINLLDYDLKEYKLSGYSTRVISRKELNKDI
ncbi:MAG: hypothetical protein ABI091_20790 [Ferruginibacter sp.]